MLRSAGNCIHARTSSAFGNYIARCFDILWRLKTAELAF